MDPSTRNDRRDDAGGRLALALAAGALGAMLGAPAGAEAEPKICSQTARAAFRACQNEARDDYWIAVGACKNESDDEARAECRAEAEDERDERLGEECPDQKAARLEVCDLLGEDRYDPPVDPAAFLSPEETAASPNPWFPLVVGAVRCYEAGDETIRVTVTDRTKEILGVTTIVVHDVVSVDDEPIEDTEDYYVQHANGDVWYFGEIAKNFEDGELVDLEGSWTAGVDHAKPGIIMKAAPMVGDVYRQEFKLGDAEDVGEVTATDGSAMVPAASCMGDCVVTRDFTPLEPDVEEAKYYAAGIGSILEVDLESGDRVELVDCPAGP